MTDQTDHADAAPSEEDRQYAELQAAATEVVNLRQAMTKHREERRRHEAALAELDRTQSQLESDLHDARVLFDQLVDP